VNGFVDWEKTSLKPYIDLLDKHALSLMEEVRIDRRKTGDLYLFLKNKEIDMLTNTNRSVLVINSIMRQVMSSSSNLGL
jgi:hypothetical protein